MRQCRRSRPWSTEGSATTVRTRHVPSKLWLLRPSSPARSNDMSSSPGGAASPSRGSHLWNSLGNAPVVGLMAILAFVLSLGQAGVQVWQWWQSYHAKYAMDIKSPDDVNLFCAGS